MYLGLFTHLDRIIRYNKKIEDFLRRHGFFKRFMKGIEKGGEFIISEEEYNVLKKLKGRRRVGGNAGNAAQFLSFNRIKSIISCPLRPKSLMKILGRNVYVVSNGKIKRARISWRNDQEIEHIVIEKDGKRVIFTYDPVARNFILDEEFWEVVGKPLFLSGFHIIPGKIRRTKEISELIEEKKIICWIELGEPLENMKKHLKVLIDNEFVRYLGMNEKEGRIFSEDILEVPRKLYEDGKFCLIHSKKFWLISLEKEIDKRVFFEISKRINFWAIWKKISNIIEIKKIFERPITYFVRIKEFKRLRRATGLGDCISSIFQNFIHNKKYLYGVGEIS